MVTRLARGTYAPSRGLGSREATAAVSLKVLAYWLLPVNYSITNSKVPSALQTLFINSGATE